MRLWSVHPRYLDTRGLLAVWREGLLAQQVLQGKTRGYRNHPQLRRFVASNDPVGAIAVYLRGIYQEAAGRGYRFSEGKIDRAQFGEQIACTRGQLLYEWTHLLEKLKKRDPGRYQGIEGLAAPAPHPLFRITEGGIEDWEVVGER